jgi:excinuclease ABC subunit A
MSTDALIVRGAREHNLRNIDVTIPRGTLTVITGLSGSGKSSLAFDTVFAEGQRRFPRPRQTGDHGQSVAGNRDVDILEIVFACAANDQPLFGHNP